MRSYSLKQESERPSWPNKVEYHLSICSYVLGLITFWRFPYLAYENDGAPFLYIFLFLFVLVGIPLLFLELTWGQYGNLSPLQAFKAVPAMQGVGICMLFLSFSCVIYFGSASYYFLLYLASSFSYSQPWTACDNSWNTNLCRTSLGCFSADQNQSSAVQIRTVEELQCNSTVPNISRRSTPSIEFWTQNLASADDVCFQYSVVGDVLNGLGSSNIVLAPIIVLSCFAGLKLIISLIALANFVRLTGKIAYILSPIPLIVMSILLARAVSLDGSTDGLLALVVPRNLKSFVEPKVWKDACGQVFLSVMTASGGLVTWSSYNRFYNKYQYNAILIIVVVLLSSLISTVTVFSTAGYLSYGTDIDPLKVLDDVTGPIAPLVAYSETLTQIWGGPFVWSMVVFASLFLATAASAFPYMECLLSSLADSIPAFHTLLLRNLTSLTFLLLTMVTYIGVPCFMTGVGMQIISFFDAFAFPLSMMIIALVEMMMILYSFGLKLLYTNAKAMTNCSCMKSHFWTFVWGILSPLLILGCMTYTVFGIVRYGVKSMASEIVYDTNSMWIDIAGGIYVGFVFLVLVLVALTKVILSRGSCKEKFRNAFSPHEFRHSGSNGTHSSSANGNLFLSEYSSHHPHRMEMLIDEDIVTTV